MNETEEQRHARWSREREIDKVAIPLGLAYQSHQRGIVYWHAPADDDGPSGFDGQLANETLLAENRAKVAALKARVAELEAQLSKATPVGFWHTHPEHARRGEFSSNAPRCADRADGWTEQTVTVTAQGVS